MKCPRCQHENPSGQKFCGNCGTPLQRLSETAYASYSDVQRSLTEALEQQQATAEILRVISSSPTELQAVLDAVAESATRLCAAYDAVIFRLDGDVLRIVAHRGPISATTRTVPIRGTVSGRAVLGRQPIHVADLQAEMGEFPEGVALAREYGFHTLLSVPLLREGAAIGTINLRRTEVRPFTDTQVELLKTFADQAVIAIENVRLFEELQEKNRVITEALERQTATSEILSVISSSPTDVRPVFESLVASAARLCGANDLLLLIREGDVLCLAAGVGSLWEGLAADFRVPLVRGSVAARSVIDGATLHVPDLAGLPEADFPVSRDLQRRFGHHTVLAVPLSRKGVALGTIFAMRFEVRPFADQQIALLKTFADQAVIAIENVRLFTETKEALDRQTATSEILRVISRSPIDVQPVFDAIASSSLRLCDGVASFVFRYDGALIHLAAFESAEGVDMQPLRHIFPGPLERVTFVGRVVTTAHLLYIGDIENDQGAPPGLVEFARANGFRSIFAAPMLRDGRAIGAIAVTHRHVDGFTAKQGALLETFADQAVIAIENVRLFRELQEKNQALTAAHSQVTEALERQTATSEILRVISGSPTNLQPVLDAVAERAARLCSADDVKIHLVDGDTLRLAARLGPIPSVEARPIIPTRHIGRAVLERRTIHIHDMQLALDEFPDAATDVRTFGARTSLATPLLREGRAIGVVQIRRLEVEPFSEKQIALLETFADQAVIAIENVRLFKELEARTAALTRSVEELTALGDVGRALSSTLDLEMVLQTIVTRANELAGTGGCSIYEYDEVAQLFRLRASSYADPREAETLDPIGRATPIPRGQGAASRAAALRQPIQIPDIAVEGAYESPIREPLRQAGYRSILTVPLLLEDQVIGALGISRKMPGEFAPEIVRLLTTFATQSALAIQNARLFREIEIKSRELEVAGRHKSEFLANMSHELRTPLNAVIGFSEVLGARMFGELNDKQDEYVQDIHASGQHLLSLINDILDLSKIEAGKMELELSDFDLPMTIDNALMLVRERAVRRSIALNTAVDERVGQVQADERKIRQVLLNLLSNAIKFTSEGGRIHVEARSLNESIEVSVTDTGVGIAPEDQKAVFE